MTTQPLDFDVAKALAELLQEAKLVPRFNAPIGVLPAQFDLLYVLSIAASTIDALGKPDKKDPGTKVLNASLFKFGQFIGTRPHLVREYELWRQHQKDGQQLDLESWPLLPRGFLTDEVPDAALGYLVAAGQLQRCEQNVRFASRTHKKLAALLASIIAQDAFRTERNALSIISEHPPKLNMLGVQ